LTDNKIKLSGFFDAAASMEDATLQADFAAGQSRTWIYGPYGTTVGNVKYTGTGYLTSYNIKGTVSDAVAFDAEIRITGAVTRTVF
jgi:hypothetical protein